MPGGIYQLSKFISDSGTCMQAIQAGGMTISGWRGHGLLYYAGIDADVETWFGLYVLKVLLIGLRQQFLLVYHIVIRRRNFLSWTTILLILCFSPQIRVMSDDKLRQM